MFRGKLITSYRYYALRKHELLFTIISSLLIGVLVGMFFQFGITGRVIVAVIFLLSHVSLIILNRRIRKYSDSGFIELDGEQMRILRDEGEEKIDVVDADRLIVKENYEIPGNSAAKVWNELIGKVQKNYIIVYRGDVARRFDFELESHYMIAQLEKAIEQWSQAGVELEIADE